MNLSLGSSVQNGKNLIVKKWKIKRRPYAQEGVERKEQEEWKTALDYDPRDREEEELDWTRDEPTPGDFMDYEDEDEDEDE